MGEEQGMSTQPTKQRKPHTHRFYPGNVVDWIYDEKGTLWFAIIQYDCFSDIDSGELCPAGEFERRLIQVSKIE